MNSIHKNNLKKLTTSNEITKDTYPNIQSNKKKKQRTRKNKFGAKDTETPDVPTRKNDKKNSEVFQEIQINTNSKTKQKLKSKNRLHAKDTNSKTKQEMKNKNDAKDTKRSNVPTKYPKDNNRTSEVLQNATDTNNKTKHKKRRNRKRKQNMNLNHANSAVTINDTKERNNKLQMSTKNLDFEHKKTKIEKLKKINEKKIKRTSAKVEAQQMKSDNISKLNKHKINIKQLEKMLPSKSQLKSKVQPTLRDRMMTQLRASRFRFINEILYNNNSSQSKHYFKTDPDAFMAYHAGYKQQLEQWAVNPLDVIITSIKKLFVYSTLSLKETYTIYKRNLYKFIQFIQVT